MQPMSEKQARSVWARVMQAKPVMAESAEAEGQTMPAASPSLGEKLQEWIADEAHDCAVYEALSRRCGGSAASVLCQIARQERCHQKTWQTLYFLCTGSCPEKAAVTPEPILSVCQQLRKSYEGELTAWAGYLQASETYPEYAELLTQTALQEKAHAEQIFRVLQRNLH